MGRLGEAHPWHGVAKNKGLTVGLGKEKTVYETDTRVKIQPVIDDERRSECE